MILILFGAFLGFLLMYAVCWFAEVIERRRKLEETARVLQDLQQKLSAIAAEKTDEQTPAPRIAAWTSYANSRYPRRSSR